ncbi:MAG: hypothetical protein UY72_C0025G0016 [Candidatus Uhrbacteria bacterium GW2011_GWD2_52_7]|uniref:Uncharacterized protein n=1 Tax=Candidatus Uhrbacteria bacterium GW2011_GWD2_52_7 TaxID=1618989 RepID=A0A0G1XGK6_9BACT|nr:MAG: hypothetical protein UY72_C0025G0016 [Candidatus Uhrbacteria bacterium GW2011_GWD2_52_7]
MRVQVLFGERMLAEVLEAISPAQPLITNEKRGFLAAELDTGKIEDLRAIGYVVREDVAYAAE